MPRLYKKAKKIGLPPGTLSPVEGSQKARIRVMDYNDKTHKEVELLSIEESFPYKDSSTVSWINIDGRDIDAIQKIDERFGIHSLVLEDILSIGQRPKVENYEDYFFFVLKMIYEDKEKNDLEAEQISLILGKNYVISFQEKEGDIFDSLRQRIRDDKGRVRKMGPDYLAYCLLDAIVDHYFTILENIGEKIDHLEERILHDTKVNIPTQIHKLKTQIIFLRKQIWPLREVLASLQRNESKLIKKETDIYLRDVYDHTIQINDTLEAFRDALAGLHDIHLSSISNHMNEVMKVLTMFASIFIPLTFIAGIYGMNFEYIPELKWPYGYFMALGGMMTLGVGMAIYFKIKKWF